MVMDDSFVITLTRRNLGGKPQHKPEDVPKVVANIMRTSLRPIVHEVRSKLPGGALKSHTRFSVSQTPYGAIALLETGGRLPYAGVHAKWDDSPTIIRPKKGEYLAIPISSQRSAAQKLFGDPKNPTSLWEYHPTLKRGRGSRAHVLYWRGSGGKIPYFHLKKQVKIKPSVNLTEVADNMISTVIMRLRKEFTDYGFDVSLG
jgi:hypothetical protein